MLKIGLTGGIASGKTAVSDMFAALGAAIIDTDIVAREVVMPGAAGLTAIAEAFGDGVMHADGTLNRAALSEIVFSDTAERHKLEALLHPLIRARTMELSQAAKGPYLVIAVPLLVETSFDALVDRVLVVDCEPTMQHARLVSRDRIDAATADAIMHSQASRQARLDKADDVLDNNGTLADLQRAVEALHQYYMSLTPDPAKASSKPS